jgi:AAA+ superfamily predicted ATPase
MSEPRLAIVKSTESTAAARLESEVAIIAGRLAEFLAGLAPAARDALADDITFLRDIAKLAAGSGRQWQAGSSTMHPLDRLIARLDLLPVEVNVLLLAALAESHEGYARVLRVLHPRGEPRPTVGLAAQVFCNDAAERRALHEVLELGSAVRSGALVTSGDGPFHERALALAEALWPVLNDLDVWPATLRAATGVTPVTGLEEWLGTSAALRARAALRSAQPRIVVVFADNASIAAERACALAANAGVPVARLVLPANAGETVERLIALHALARGVVPIVELAPAETAIQTIPEFRSLTGPIVVCAREGGTASRGARPVVTLNAGRPPSAARQRLWREALPELAELAPTLAARYIIEPVTALQVATDVRSIAALDVKPVGLADIARSVRVRCNTNTSSNAKLVQPTAEWDDLVLPDDRMAQLGEALNRLLHQGRVIDEWGFLANRPGARGVRMLFSGPPGTGKSLAAEVMAHRLGVDLLVIDIARLVSKWIGETEKNLAEAFDAAERMQVVLLFDEADALFGKRTEVSDSHDRYANLETAYLLSRLERFEGLAILSTNLRQNIDPAFIRRLEFVVEFDEPAATQREALWRRHLPPAAPLAPDVRLDEFAAHYPIVGGLIRNAAVAAGFLAAAASSPITRDHLVRAVWREYAKAGRAFPGAHPDAASQ